MEIVSPAKEVVFIGYLQKTFTNFCSDFWLKCIGFWGYIAASYFFDLVQAQALIALLGLILFDFITGVIASHRTEVAIKSSKVFRTAIKIFLYFMLISGGHLTEVIIGYNFFIDDIVLAFLAVTELLSILENTSRIGFAVPQKLLLFLRNFKNSK